MSVTEFLQTKVPFLGELKEEHIALLASQVEQLKFKNGQTVLFKGTSVDGLHIVVQGKVTVHAKMDKKGWAQVAELGEGEIFGETSIIEYKMAGATIKAGADDTLIYMIPQAPFLELLRQDEALKSKMVEIIRSRQAERHKDEKPAAPGAANAKEPEAAGEATPAPDGDAAAPPQDAPS